MFGGVVDFEGSHGDGEGKAGFLILGEDAALRHLKPILVGIVYFERKIVEGMGLEKEDKLLSNDTFGFDIIIMLTSVGQSKFNRTAGFLLAGNCVLRKCEDE